MSAIDSIIERATGLRRPNEWEEGSLSCSLDENKTGEIQPMGFATQEQYRLELRVTSIFWANRAEHSECRRHAEAVIVQLLYDDALLPLRRLRQAIMDGDKRAAFSWCCKLEDVMVKP